MKKTHFIAGMSAALMLTGLLVSCGNKVADDDQTLQIFCVDAGYKTEWCQQIKDKFKEQDWVKEKYPNLKIVVQTSDNQTYGRTRMDAGRSSNTIDLFFDMGLMDYDGSDDLLDLTDVVYETQVPGESILYKDKISKSYYEAFKFDGKSNPAKKNHHFFSPWAGGMCGILYNATFFNDLGYTVPNTTDELTAICNAYQQTGTEASPKYSFIQGNDESYFNYLFDIFWTQYQSKQGYTNFNEGIDDDTYSKNIFKQKGRLEALKVYEDLVSYSHHYVNPASISKGFAVAQGMFLKGESLMNVNGDWFVSETKSMRDKLSVEYDIRMMKTPVVSSIIEVVPDGSIADDAELSALIKAIDAHQPALSGTGYEVTQDDYNYVLEARSVTYSIGAGHHAAIPSYASAKEVAVDFIRFMATDVAQDTYIKATDGASLPFNYDLKTKNPELFNEIDPLHKERLDYFADTYIKPDTLKSRYSFPLIKYGGVDTFRLPNGYDFFVQMGKQSNPKTAQQYYDETISYWTDEKWNDALERAGLK